MGNLDYRKLRIALLSAHSCPVGPLGSRDTGGMSVYIRELAGELDRLGHTVDIYTRVHDPNDPVVVDLGERSRVIHLKAGDEYQIHKLAIYSCLPEFGCNIEAFRKANDIQYDVLFSHYWLSGYLGNYIRLWWSVPHVLMFHTLGAVKNASGSGDDADLRIETEREVIRDGQRIVASTEREMAELISYYDADPGKIGIVPCGVNMDLFRTEGPVSWYGDGPEDELRLLFVGRIDPVKGINQLLRALPLIRSTRTVRLLVIGGDDSDSSELSGLRKLASELGVEDRVSFLGRLQQEELPAYYRAADLCIVPSYNESFGLVSLEALACGTPVVASDVGEMKKFIRDGVNGYVSPDNSPENLAACINRAIKDFNGNTVDTKAIRDSIEAYTWNAVAKGIIRQLHAALSLEPSPAG